MANTPKTPAGSNPLPGGGDVDRVAMLSLDKTGRPDQTPGVEMIGDRSFAEAATREQFRQQAVSAEDVRVRGVAADAGTAETDAPQDPSIVELTDAHEAAEGKATKAADAAVKALFTDDPALQATPAPSAPAADGNAGDSGAGSTS